MRCLHLLWHLITSCGASISRFLKACRAVCICRVLPSRAPRCCLTVWMSERGQSHRTPGARSRGVRVASSDGKVAGSCSSLTKRSALDVLDS